MEGLSTLCFILFFLCILALVPSFIVWLILLIKKKPAKKVAMFIFLGVVSGILFFPILGVIIMPTCDHNWETLVKTEATCITNGNTVQHCTICDNEKDPKEIPALGHNWVETVTDATCTVSGKHSKKCSTCGEETIEILEAHHNYTETVLSAPECETEGKAQLVCDVCNDSQEKTIPATGHAWGNEKTIIEAKCEEDGKAQLICTICGSTKDKVLTATGHSWKSATCIVAKTCSICNTTDGVPTGHDTDAGVCSRCNETVLKKSPITIIGMRYSIDFLGGVEWTFKIRNNSDKEIKYVTLEWDCYNAVGDPIRDEISGKSYVRLQYTGPLAPGETTSTRRNTTLFYNHSYSNLVWTEITVEYMDGTIERITSYYKDYYQQ